MSEEERSRGDIRWPYCSPSASLASPVALVAQPGPCFAFLASERICHLKIPHLPLTWRPLTPSGRPLAPLPLAPLCLTGRAHCDTNGLADKGPCETEREGGREGAGWTESVCSGLRPPLLLPLRRPEGHMLAQHQQPATSALQFHAT